MNAYASGMHAPKREKNSTSISEAITQKISSNYETVRWGTSLWTETVAAVKNRKDASLCKHPMAPQQAAL